MSVIGSNLASLFWTNRQKIRTPEQFSSTPKELYSTVPNATHVAEGVIMGKLEGTVAVITGGLRTWETFSSGSFRCLGKANFVADIPAI
jgi:hypothetical protein